jgi:hypothetical protein
VGEVEGGGRDVLMRRKQEGSRREKLHALFWQLFYAEGKIVVDV